MRLNKIVSAVFVLALMLIILSACTQQVEDEVSKAEVSSEQEQKEINEEELLALAQKQVSDMLNGDFKSTADSFSEEVAAQLDETSLKAAWDTTVATLAEHIGRYSVEGEKVDEYFSVVVVEEYEAQGLKVTITYDINSKIVGLNLNYAPIERELELNYEYEEIPFTVGEEIPLNGVLTLPKGIEKPPVVVIVSGSGPTDKDGTIYTNTPYKDIAYGLAKQGVASLRYDDRFYAQPAKAAEFGLNLENETLDDVSIAINMLAEDERVDGTKIYVLGHSLGGSIAPAIAYKNENVYGIISMAGTLRPIYELAYDQIKAVEATFDGSGLSEQEQALAKEQFAQADIDIETLRGDISSLLDFQVLLGFTAEYQKSIKEYVGLDYIDKIDLPILVLQGSEDFQVYADKDYVLWQDTLKDRENAEFKMYDGLNHLMMQTNGKTDISEYEIKGEVAQEVIDDIASFVNK